MAFAAALSALFSSGSAQQPLAYALGEVKASRVERKYPVMLTLGPAHFTDLNTVEIAGMSLVPTRSAPPIRCSPPGACRPA
ncbi:MAG: hypothetical protein WKG07_41590 [Hymenobacter sp.]